MLEQYPKLKKLFSYYPIYIFFAVGYYIFIKVYEPTLFTILATVSFWLSIPTTYFISHKVNNLQIIKKIKYSPNKKHELLNLLITFCQLPLWIVIVLSFITISEMIAK
jgi:hypothetical protein